MTLHSKKEKSGLFGNRQLVPKTMNSRQTLSTSMYPKNSPNIGSLMFPHTNKNQSYPSFMVTLWWGSPRIARYGTVLLSNAGRSPKSCLLGCSRCAAPVASSAPTSVEFQLRHPRRERSLAARPWSKPSFGWWHSTSFYISLPYSTIFCHVVPTLHIYIYMYIKQYNNIWKKYIIEYYR